MDDGSDGLDGRFEPPIAALRRAKGEFGVAVGHGVEEVRNWVARRWLPIRFVMIGGFSWATGRAFGWLWSHLFEFGSWLVSSLAGITASVSGPEILLVFFAVYVIHSGIQTKLILVIKTKTGDMNSEPGPHVRTDGGEDFSTRLGAIGGIVIGVILGWSFGIDGVFVGAGLGWVLGDEFDRRFEAKVNGIERTCPEEQNHVEQQ